MNRNSGFTLIEIIMVIIIIGIIAAVAVPKFFDLNDRAEKNSVEYVIGSLKAALAVSSSHSTATGAAIVLHNPFDDLVTKPDNYVGSFPDVTTANFEAGEWAYQSGSGANANTKLVVYYPKQTLKKGFLSEGILFICLELTAIKNSQGVIIGINLSDLIKWGGKPHEWFN